MKFFKELKKNNKGFSLVELIIVIAIMAVLVGTLAPQYIRYVEKSRIAADATTIGEFESVLQVIAATPDNGLATSNATYSVTYDSSTGEMKASDGLTGLSLYKELVDTTKKYKIQSDSYKAGTPSVALQYDSTSKIWKVVVSGVPGATTTQTTTQTTN